MNDACSLASSNGGGGGAGPSASTCCIVLTGGPESVFPTLTSLEDPSTGASVGASLSFLLCCTQIGSTCFVAMVPVGASVPCAGVLVTGLGHLNTLTSSWGEGLAGRATGVATALKNCGIDVTPTFPGGGGALGIGGVTS